MEIEQIINKQLESVLLETLSRIKQTIVIEPNNKKELKVLLDTFKKDIKSLKINLSSNLENEIEILEETLRKL